MKKNLSEQALNVWRVFGQEIYDARQGHVDNGFGIRAISSKYSLGFRMAERLLTHIDMHGPRPPNSAMFSDPPESSDSNEGTGATWTEKNDQATLSGKVKSLADLIRVAGVDQEKWRVDSWQARTWDANIGNGNIETMYYVKANLERWIGDRLQSPAQIPELKLEPLSQRMIDEPFERVFIIPDTQIGYRRTRKSGRPFLNPIHDREGMDAVWAACADLQPHRIILLGDMLDLAEMSTKYPRPPELVNTSQPAILELGWWCRRLRQACPSSQIIYMEGNHEQRLDRLMIEKASMAQDLKADGENLNALSIERLLNLSALDIQYVGPYGTDYWLWSDTDSPVKIHHGEIVRAKGGQTVSAQLAKYHHSVVGGHVHRVELAMATNHGPQGRRQRFAMSPGCLCKTDGSVPGATLQPDWQQGYGIISRDTKSGELFPEVVSVMNGQTTMFGKRYRGRNIESIIAKDIGWAEISSEYI